MVPSCLFRVPEGGDSERAVVQRVQAARLRARDRARRHQATALSLRSRQPSEEVVSRVARAAWHTAGNSDK